jgi:hypothetical protein
MLRWRPLSHSSFSDSNFAVSAPLPALRRFLTATRRRARNAPPSRRDPERGACRSRVSRFRWLEESMPTAVIHGPMSWHRASVSIDPSSPGRDFARVGSPMSSVRGRRPNYSTVINSSGWSTQPRYGEESTRDMTHAVAEILRRGSPPRSASRLRSRVAPTIWCSTSQRGYSWRFWLSSLSTMRVPRVRSGEGGTIALSKIIGPCDAERRSIKAR